MATTPADGGQLTRATVIRRRLGPPWPVALVVTYLLMIGTGLTDGEQTLAVEAKTAFSQPIDQIIAFISVQSRTPAGLTPDRVKAPQLCRHARSTRTVET